MLGRSGGMGRTGEVPMTPTELRLALRHKGHDPLPLYGKAPSIEEWEKKFNTTDEEIRFWSKAWHLAHNTGVIAKRTPGLDIDIFDPDAAEAVEGLAREHFEERGDILWFASGLPPKRLIPLRTDEPFPKLKRKFIAPNGKKHQIEVLGDGQQWVSYGIHPTTGEPYRWHGGELASTPRKELPYVRREDMLKFLDDAERLLVEQVNYALEDTATDDGAPHEAGEEPQASIELIAAALAVIPNSEDWDGWNAIGMATWRATGGSAEGFAAFDAWSKKSPKYAGHNTAAKWASYSKSPPTHIGAGTIFYLADQASPSWRQDYENNKPLPYVDLSLDLKPREWLVPDRIPMRNVALLSGEGAIGKSLLLMQLGGAVALGREWIGTWPTQGPVLYVSCEEDDDEVRRRMEDVAVHLGAPRDDRPWP
jgi:hypothetical protein